MTKKITQEQLLLFYYNELETNELKQVQEALDSNNDLKLEYDAICHEIVKIPSSSAMPSSTSINIILENSILFDNKELV